MRASENPEYLRSVAAAVTEFRDALTHLLELYVPNTTMALGLAPAVLRRDGVRDEELARRTQAVAVAAGRAAQAPALTSMAINVQGMGSVDPIAAWATMTRPKPLLEPTDVFDACDQMLGRLDGLVAEARASVPPDIGAAAMHPLVWGAAESLWRDRHYRQAVAAAAEALVGQLKARLNRYDLPDTALWQEAFSDRPPTPGKARLRWPGEGTDRDVKNMNDGLRLLAPGLQMTVRNAATHSEEELLEQAALERLAALSLLATWVARCELAE